MNRRHFIKTSAAGLAASTLSEDALSAVIDGPPKRVGLIGTGWYGKADLFRLIQVAPVEVVSLCDVDKQLLKEAADMVSTRQKSGKRPRTYADYREMLANKDLDIVLIATPDHWHALNMIEAVKAGADVYVQKPISVDIREGQAMLQAARQYGRVVQVGTQRRSTPHLIDAKKRFIDTGALGKIAHAEICCYYHMRNRSNPPNEAPPSHLDYDMWTGPAPLRPYNNIVHQRGWRSFMEYGNGIVGDMCIHMLDTVRWMLDLGWPTQVSSSGGILVDKAAKANISDTQTATFDFKDLQVVWQHRTWGHSPDPAYPWAAFLYGDKGTLKLSVNSYDFIPQQRGADAVHQDVVMELDQYPEDRTEKDLERHVAPAIRGHMVDFLNAIASRGKPVADIEQGHISTASCILANMSMELGRALSWDAQKGEILKDAEANQKLARAYRSPWNHPFG
ncbi:MAG: Gfo/Idh/MocA family oxidoreductase [Verrucomicrobiales bacterium]|jgi:predicted dehydrogenase|nr:oxidoreductase [Pedosphaera sp.]MEC7199905.1 Gfo/Idh/MocA family oxidoreductase [Verrucomicrobiota bacterium]HBF02701.1 oxidoreductase [Verrucomicrobiales bacterium]MAN31575.1 oxidoreductase [Pedosphaera sp.]MEC7905036.1 Gfo/Idh/MocA family oxidoreductase [Verrucomicrobiota bacterium]